MPKGGSGNAGNLQSSKWRVCSQTSKRLGPAYFRERPAPLPAALTGESSGFREFTPATSEILLYERGQGPPKGAVKSYGGFKFVAATPAGGWERARKPPRTLQDSTEPWLSVGVNVGVHPWRLQYFLAY